MYKFEFTIPKLPPTTNSHGRSHWAVKAKIAKEWKAAVFIMVGNKRPKKPLIKARVTLTRHSSSACDADGLVSSFKHILDGLKFAGVLLDDSMKIIGMPLYSWKKAPRGKGFITVKVEELSDEDNIRDEFLQDKSG